MRFYFFSVLLLVFFQQGLFAQTRKVKVQFFAGVGGDINKIKTFGSGEIGGMRFSRMNNGHITVGATFLQSRFPRLALQLATTYQKFAYDADGKPPVFIYPRYYEFDGYQIIPSLCLLYHIVQGDKWRVYVGGGAGLSLTKYTYQRQLTAVANTSIISEYDYHFSRAWLSGDIKAGVGYKHIDLATYLSRGRIAKNDEGGIRISTLGIQLNYHLR